MHVLFLFPKQSQLNILIKEIDMHWFPPVIIHWLYPVFQRFHFVVIIQLPNIWMALSDKYYYIWQLHLIFAKNHLEWTEM